MKAEKIKVLIIGSGPAGFTAALYAARAGLSPVLYQGKQPGGQLTTTTVVENYPGYPKGVDGTQMMEDMKAQAEKFGTEVRSGTITEVDFSCYPLEAIVDSKHKIEAKAVIIATGASPKWLGLTSEKLLYGKGVTSCAVCDGFFYKGQEVAVVGGGDSAAEEASYLSNICKKVYVLVRKNKMRASQIMQRRLATKHNIEILYDTVTKEILGKNEVEGVRIHNVKNNKEIEIPIKGFFVAIGHQPNTKLFLDYLECDQIGYLKTHPGSTQTNVKGVFAAGDVQDHTYRQAVTAAGTGCMAALEAEKFLAEKETEH